MYVTKKHRKAHPYAHILTDCLSLVFQYHIHQPQNSLHTYSETDLAFFRRHITCWDFHHVDKMTDFLETTRGLKLKLWYVSFWEMHNDAFPYFRGIHTLKLANRYGYRLSTDVLKNFHGTHTLRLQRVSIALADFIHFRGVQHLSLHGIHQLTNEAFLHLRGIKRLKLQNCGINEDVFENLRGIESLSVINCTWVVTDASFVNLRGIRELRLTNCTPNTITDAAFDNLRGIKKLVLQHSWSSLTDKAFKNLVGIEALELFGCSNITDAGLRYIRGVKDIRIWECSGITDSGLSAMREATKVLLDATNAITDSGLRNLRSAIALDIYSCNITDVKTFENFRNVRQLRVALNARIGDDAFKPLKNLRDLHLDFYPDVRENSTLTKKMFQYLRGLEKLEFEELPFDLLEEDVAEAAQCLPNLKSIVIGSSMVSDAWTDFVHMVEHQNGLNEGN